MKAVNIESPQYLQQLPRISAVMERKATAAF